jgi:hypothetical protein
VFIDTGFVDGKTMMVKYALVVQYAVIFFIWVVGLCYLVTVLCLGC